MELTELMGRSFEHYLRSLDAAIYRELRDINAFISAMEDEICQLQPYEIKFRCIPGAGIQPDAVVETTEQATNTIMELAEAVMAANPSDARVYHGLVQVKMLHIFEARAFQHLTGQRIEGGGHAAVDRGAPDPLLRDPALARRARHL